MADKIHRLRRIHPPRRWTTKRFIKASKRIHGNKYDYSQTILVNVVQKLIIICPEHGPFKQTPMRHLAGHGCPKCAIKYSPLPLSKKQFVRMASRLHGQYKYFDLPETIYDQTILDISCRSHGRFKQLAYNHMRGHGCPRCTYTTESLQLRMAQWINKCKRVHQGKYDYSLVTEGDIAGKVLIICPKHGPFIQLPNDHLNKCRCPQCAKEPSDIDIRREKFIEKARKVHGDKYDYSRVNYINTKTKVEIICPKHGPFWQLPNRHIYRGCVKCATKRLPSPSRHSIRTHSTSTFITNAQKIHGNKYDYSKVNYINNKSKIIIICPEHGEFKQSPHTHLIGHGCPKCGIRYPRANRVTIDEFIRRAREVHGDKYDYSKVVYKTDKKKVEIICPIHGSFWQSPRSHVRHHSGCPECSKIEMGRNHPNHLIAKQEFVSKARKVHGDKYDYSKVEYSNNLAKVEIICPQHGSFKQIPRSHLDGCGCPRCPTVISSGHQQIIDYIKSIYDGEIIINDRETISPQELDIYLPQKKLAVEFNGTYWHSFDRPATNKEILYHQQKHLICLDKNITLLQINEYEWNDKQSIIASMIKHKLGLSERIPARKCKLVKLQGKQHKEFMDCHHIYGQGNYPSVVYGLIYNDELVSVMSFLRHHRYQWLIHRYASLGAIVGGASKLFKAFIKEYSPSTVTTFADARFGTGETYKKLGFKLVALTHPNFVYLKNGKWYRRQHYQKHKQKDKLPSFDPSLTCAQNMYNNGFRRIYDAGHYKYQIDLQL